jgi:hypothetical protein
MFDVVDKRDDILDTADNDDGDDDTKNSIDDQEDTFDALEDDGDNLDTNKTTPLDGFSFWHFKPDLPFFFSVAVIFGGVDVFSFVTVLSTTNAILILDVWYLSRRKVSCPSWVTGRFLSEVCFKHLFLVDVELNQSTSYAANFGSCFIMDLIQWAFFLGWHWLSGLSKTSLFLMFDVDDERDDVLDTADNDDGDDDNKKSINDWEDTFDVVEDDGDNLDTNKMTPLEGFIFFFDTSTLTYHSFFQSQSSLVG